MDPVAMLHKRLEGRSLRSLAIELGISAPYLSDILAGRRKPGPKVLKPLGIEKTATETVTYRRKRAAQ